MWPENVAPVRVGCVDGVDGRTGPADDGDGGCTGRAAGADAVGRDGAAGCDDGDAVGRDGGGVSFLADVGSSATGVSRFFLRRFRHAEIGVASVLSGFSTVWSDFADAATAAVPVGAGSGFGRADGVKCPTGTGGMIGARGGTDDGEVLDAVSG